jgi:chromosome partitioning protein
MVVVAVISRKGGVGKSTIAVHLAVEAAKAGPVAVVDLDVQASAAGWGDSRSAEQPAVVTCPPAKTHRQNSPSLPCPDHCRAP